MQGFVTNIERETQDNTNFRRVLYTSGQMQLVVMHLSEGEEIGEETHHLDQFIRVEAGEGKAVLDGTEHPLQDGDAVVIPAGVRHNIINTAQSALKLYTIYSPPEHKDGTVHQTKADAMADENDHFSDDK